jgi:hypothetical protein
MLARVPVMQRNVHGTRYPGRAALTRVLKMKPDNTVFPAQPHTSLAHRAINDSTDALLTMDNGRYWRFRVKLVSALDRAYQWMSKIVKLLLGALGLRCEPPHSSAIPKPMSGPVYQGL